MRWVRRPPLGYNREALMEYPRIYLASCEYCGVGEAYSRADLVVMWRRFKDG